jgi:hypothetical protein
LLISVFVDYISKYLSDDGPLIDPKPLGAVECRLEHLPLNPLDLADSISLCAALCLFENLINVANIQTILIALGQLCDACLISELTVKCVKVLKLTTLLSLNGLGKEDALGRSSEASPEIVLQGVSVLPTLIID